MPHPRLSAPVTVSALAYLLIACSGDDAYLGPIDFGGEGAGSNATRQQAVDASAGQDSATKQQMGADAGALHALDAGASGIPCEIDSLLQRHCRSCHGARLIGGAPMALLSYADLLAASSTNIALSNAQRSLQMMQASSMPPGGGLAATDLTLFDSWIQNGTPMGSCASATSDAGAASDPFDTPVVCSSNKKWTGGNRESPLMHPGDACISCHSRGEGPKFALAGTLYPSAHEPNDCNGTNPAGASVVVTDANGTEHTLTPNAAGNFYLSSLIKTPYTAKLTYQGRTRAMAAKQTDGDCNSCHSESGDKGAPGRLMLP
ncbi:MAG: hypothetical protein RLZZ450_5245 [Pseudomonadota bacterium]